MNSVLLHSSVRSAARVEFSRSGGPGGQNVNKVSTKATLRMRLDDLAGLNDAELARVRAILAGRINAEDEILISSDEERSQHINRERAFTRLIALVASAARLPRSRRPTRPSRAAREERLNSKHRLAHKKSERRFSPEE
ncbi:MAG: aminoacyl-tRNA hydrolase [Treponema sp.]|jgi:ribosome-associated protein|nr:aminoacyl-tRNA hydrolase [Treponema sp.]